MDYKNNALKVESAEINAHILTADLNKVSKVEKIETSVDISRIKFEVVSNNCI